MHFQYILFLTLLPVSSENGQNLWKHDKSEVQIWNISISAKLLPQIKEIIKTFSFIKFETLIRASELKYSVESFSLSYLNFSFFILPCMMFFY